METTMSEFIPDNAAVWFEIPVSDYDRARGFYGAMLKNGTDLLNAADEPKLKPSPRTVGDVVEGQMMLVPTARQVDEFMRGIPAGTSVDVRTLRKAMAARHGAEVTCPVYMGYHL